MKSETLTKILLGILAVTGSFTLFKYAQTNQNNFGSDLKPPHITIAETISTTTVINAIYRIDINEADYNDFLQLGISENLATACIELRGKISYFSNTLELLYAEGMTKEIYNEISDYVYVE